MKNFTSKPCFFPKQGGVSVIMTVFLLMFLNAGILQAGNELQKISINKVNAKVATILEDIEAQTAFRFFYKTGEVDVNRLVTFQVKRREPQ